jgi:hypothetical protein
VAECENGIEDSPANPVKNNDGRIEIKIILRNKKVINQTAKQPHPYIYHREENKYL